MRSHMLCDPMPSDDMYQTLSYTHILHCIISFLVFFVFSFFFDSNWLLLLSSTDLVLRFCMHSKERWPSLCYAHTVSITRRLATNRHFNLKELSAKHVLFHYSDYVILVWLWFSCSHSIDFIFFIYWMKLNIYFFNISISGQIHPISKQIFNLN